MLMNSQKLAEMSDTQFEELVSLIRYSAMNASDLSSNVAMTFLSTMALESKSEAQPNLDLVNEDDRRYMDYIDEEKALEPDLIDSISSSSSSRRERRSRFTTFRFAMSRLFNISKRREARLADMNESNIESDRRNKKEKFTISYADLMKPSTFKYEAKFLDVPMHDFRKRSLSYTDSIEVKVVPTEDAMEAPEPKVYSLPFESNTLFRNKHPWLHPTLSFTKLCRIKYVFMTLPNMVQHLDPSTSAIAWTLFERLVLIGIVTKFNRKLYSSICYILAYKFNQDYESDVINEILNIFTREKNMNVKLIFYNEMKIFTLLDFSLKLKYSYIRNHIRHYLEYNKQSFFNLYDTPESTYIMLEMD
ncbi:cyclin-like protein [Theileria orientalis]|uniref:Cyclin-like protein n=1 Tax=Theileria orientalis TaxID=68886 RepID=A0A976MER4_THEOR|nr:cyclin-like protein [Theileria orientalis]